MSFETWIAFAVTAAVVVAIPGPTVLMVISYALGHGRRAAYAIVAGVALGDFTAMTASMLGLGALLATSAEIFTAVKGVGAAYLVYLGIKLCGHRSRPRPRSRRRQSGAVPASSSTPTSRQRSTRRASSSTSPSSRSFWSRPSRSCRR